MHFSKHGYMRSNMWVINFHIYARKLLEAFSEIYLAISKWLSRTRHHTQVTASKSKVSLGLEIIGR